MKHRILKEYKFEGERMWKVINLRSKCLELLTKQKLQWEGAAEANCSLVQLKELNHQHISRLIDIEEREDELDCFWEFPKGNSLRECKNKGVSESKALNIVVQVCLTVKYIHDNGLTHGNMNSKNIWIKNEQIRITNFYIPSLIGHLRNQERGSTLEENRAMKGICLEKDIRGIGKLINEINDLSRDMQSVNSSALTQLANLLTNKEISTIFTNSILPDINDLITLLLEIGSINRLGIRQEHIKELLRDEGENMNMNMNTNTDHREDIGINKHPMEGKENISTSCEGMYIDNNEYMGNPEFILPSTAPKVLDTSRSQKLWSESDHPSMHSSTPNIDKMTPMSSTGVGTEDIYIQ